MYNNTYNTRELHKLQHLPLPVEFRTIFRLKHDQEIIISEPKIDGDVSYVKHHKISIPKNTLWFNTGTSGSGGDSYSVFSLESQSFFCTKVKNIAEDTFESFSKYEKYLKYITENSYCRPSDKYYALNMDLLLGYFFGKNKNNLDIFTKYIFPQYISFAEENLFVYHFVKKVDLDFGYSTKTYQFNLESLSLMSLNSNFTDLENLMLQNKI